MASNLLGNSDDSSGYFYGNAAPPHSQSTLPQTHPQHPHHPQHQYQPLPFTHPSGKNQPQHGYDDSPQPNVHFSRKSGNSSSRFTPTPSQSNNVPTLHPTRQQQPQQQPQQSHFTHSGDHFHHRGQQQYGQERSFVQSASFDTNQSNTVYGSGYNGDVNGQGYSGSHSWGNMNQSDGNNNHFNLNQQNFGQNNNDNNSHNSHNNHNHNNHNNFYQDQHQHQLSPYSHPTHNNQSNFPFNTSSTFHNKVKSPSKSQKQKNFNFPNQNFPQQNSSAQNPSQFFPPQFPGQISSKYAHPSANRPSTPSSSPFQPPSNPLSPQLTTLTSAQIRTNIQKLSSTSDHGAQNHWTTAALPMDQLIISPFYTTGYFTLHRSYSSSDVFIKPPSVHPFGNYTPNDVCYSGEVVLSEINIGNNCDRISAFLPEAFQKTKMWGVLGANLLHWAAKQHSKSLNIDENVYFGLLSHVASLSYSNLVEGNTMFPFLKMQQDLSKKDEKKPNNDPSRLLSDTSECINTMINHRIFIYPQHTGIYCEDFTLQQLPILQNLFQTINF